MTLQHHTLMQVFSMLLSQSWKHTVARLCAVALQFSFTGTKGTHCVGVLSEVKCVHEDMVCQGWSKGTQMAWTTFEMNWMHTRPHLTSVHNLTNAFVVKWTNFHWHTPKWRRLQKQRGTKSEIGSSKSTFGCQTFRHTHSVQKHHYK